MRCLRAIVLSVFLCFWSVASAFSAESPVLSALEHFRDPSGILKVSPDYSGFSAEVMLLEMRLRLQRGEREAFDRLYKLLNRFFRSPLGVYYAALDRDLKPLAWRNRTADDLQACRLLLDAGRRWPDGPYYAAALHLAGVILRYDVSDGLLTEGFSWKERSWQFHSVYAPRPVLMLSTVDVKLLLELQDLIPQWEPVVQRSLGVLIAGSGGRLPQKAYDLEKRTYTGRNDDALLFLTTLVHLTDGGFVPQEAVKNLRRMASDDPFCLEISRRPSIAEGVLSALVLDFTGENVLARQIMATLEQRFSPAQEGARGLWGREVEAVSIRDNLLYPLVRDFFDREDQSLESEE